MSRRRSREYVLQMLFQMDVVDTPREEVLRNFWEGRRVDQSVRQMAETLFEKTVAELDSIDEQLERTAQHWKLERMAAVDRNVLRMAVAELMLGETPAAVILDEAVEIARRYGTEKSPEFVNGVLDAVRADLEKSPA